MPVLERVAGALRFSARTFVLHLVAISVSTVFAVVGAMAIIADEPDAIEPASLPTTIALIVPMSLLMLTRRRLPLTSFACSTALLGVVRELDVPELQVSSVAWIVALYSAGRYGAGRARHVVRALGVGAMVVLIVVDLVITWDDVEAFGFTERTFVLTATANVFWNVVVFAGAWYAGDVARNRHLRDRELAARTLELEMSREENARRAVMDERVRIARELHDVVAHHVSVMGVQAGAARRALGSDPELAAAPLRMIETSSRDAVAELHRLLGFLRRVDEVDPDGLADGALDPQPGLARLGDLRGQLAAAGLALRVTIAGTPAPLPPACDLNAYRILQEALTNCLKHAGVDHAELEIEYCDDRLRLAVRDRGRGRTLTPVSRSGAGLVGMAERAALLGGSVRHGARQGGGFEVEAELPYHGAVAAAPSALPEMERTA